MRKTHLERWVKVNVDVMNAHMKLKNSMSLSIDPRNTFPIPEEDNTNKYGRSPDLCFTLL